MHKPTLGLILMFGGVAQLGAALLYARSLEPAVDDPDTFAEAMRGLVGMMVGPLAAIPASTLLVVGVAIFAAGMVSED